MSAEPTNSGIYQEITAQIMKHRSDLFAFIFSMVRNFHLAEDLLQDTCVIICAKAAQFEPGTNFMAWARAIALREAKNMHKSRKYRHASALTERAEQVARLWEWEDLADDMAERREALHHCLRNLRSRALNVFLAFYEKREGCQQIAERLRTTVPAIHMLLKRTREKLYSCVERKLAASG
ncbi:MAG: sigma-70 family RNA polymerase sigma factor [Kiritimatiellae bacterium]|nr:sigma-70 family RNA polymerase sigma factor [Kiritimatiellia bacterium]